MEKEYKTERESSGETTEYHDKWEMGEVSTERLAYTSRQHHHSEHREHSDGTRRSSEGSGGKRKSSSAKKNRRKARNAFFARHKWAIINAAVFLFFAFVIAGVVIDQAHRREDLEVALSQTEAAVDGARGGAISLDSDISLTVPFFADDPVLANGVVVSFLNGNEERFEAYRSEGEPADIGLPVTIRYGALLPSGYRLESSVIEVSENEDMSDSRVFELDANTLSASVDCLKTNTKYYYTVTLKLSDDKQASVGGTFHTADTPRVLSIPGLENVRDIGNWKTTDGRTIRQGLLIRGSAVQSSEYVTKDRLDTLALFGFAAELDLRSQAEATGIEVFDADGVRHIYLDSAAYEKAFTPEGMAKLQAVFSELADADNYPVYLHCSDGADRTATVCLLLEALLGMDREDILAEHALTDPYKADELNRAAEAFFSELDAFDGASLREKTESYLIACGNTEAEIASIRDILLG